MRSLVPMLKKSASSASRSAVSAADGTSIITPIGTSGPTSPRARSVSAARLDGRARGAQLLDARDEREHDPQRPVRGRAQQRAQLRLEDLVEREAQPDAAQAERRPRAFDARVLDAAAAPR